MSNESPDMVSAKKNPALAAALREMELKKARGPWPRRLRIIGAALAIVLIIGGATWAIRAHLKASAKADTLAALPKNPRDLFQAVRDGKIDREDAREAMQAAREAEENKRLDEYFALKTQADRNKYIDKVIDEMEARRKEWERQASTRPTTRPADRATTRPTTGPTTRPNRRNDPGRQLNNVQGGNPVRQAQRAAMMAAMRARMAQRGIQPGRGGGGGGGRGGWGGGGGGRGR
ncbi:MAG: hypothetical protein H7Z14_07585 [Anaerolineae bacterium]|nr:hypothetical protein [Phycisphaerae bacterium]